MASLTPSCSKAVNNRFSSVNRRWVDALGCWPCAQLVTAHGETPVRRVNVACVPASAMTGC